MEYLFASLILILGLGIGFLVGKYVSSFSKSAEKQLLEEQNSVLNTQLSALKVQIESQKEEYKFQLSKIENEREIIRDQKDNIQNQLTKTQTEFDNLQKKQASQKEEIENLQVKFTKEFENLANKILDQKSQKFTLSNKENIEQILNPLKLKIKEFEDKVDQTHKENIGIHSSLKQQIVDLKDLNRQMSKETLNLTKALKGDSKTQGDWGETQLETILEKSNLVNNIHYTKQGSYRDDEGKLKKPDFVINLPENRNLIIDSKVSLTAYEKYFSEENEEKHIESIRKHIKELSSKRYEQLYGINSPDYVLMFVPTEPALILALTHYNNLYLEALDRNIVLVSSSTLLATLSTVASIWQQENQKRNVLEIARQAGALYNKFEGLLKDLINVGNKLDNAKTSYSDAMNKLSSGRGNLIISVEKLKKLGAKTEKSLPSKLIDRASQDE